MTSNFTAETEAEQESTVASTARTAKLIVCLGPWYEDATAESLAPVLGVLAEALDDLTTQSLVAYPASDPNAASWQHTGLTLQPYLPSGSLHPLVVQTAETYLGLYELMRAHESTCGLLLGPDAHTVQPAAIRGLVHAVLDRGMDLALARYDISPNEGLINASMLRPLTRAVFNVRCEFPQALDLCVSTRMAERMATAAQRLTAAQQPEALLWPAAEAVVAGYNIADIPFGVRDLPHPSGGDLSSILNTVASSLFLDIEAKATFWQRTRPGPVVTTLPGAAAATVAASPVQPGEIDELIDSFRIGYGNLNEIWALVLPPQTLLGLKRLSRVTNDAFVMPDPLWVRIVYDHVLAHRMRTINRGHLMGSLTPLYLAWVASHILVGQNATAPGNNGDALTRAFEADKAYLVSRWRWPDRFNP